MDPSCPSIYKNSHLPLVSTPGCQFQSMADSRGPLNALFSFCFRLTACSLHIQRAIIFTPLFLYLEVNGCLKQTTAFATAAHQPGSFHVMQRVALSSQHLASCQRLAGRLAGKGGGGFCFDESTHDLAVTYTIQDSFSQFPTSVSLRQLVSHVSH